MLYYTHVYNKDAGLLWRSMNQIKRVDHEAEFVVINDTSAPVPAEYLPQGENITIMNAPYKLGGNLNGKEFIEGFLTNALAIMEEKQADYIIKFDCDTWINNAERLKSNLEFDYLGYSRAEPCTASGDCYRLSKKAVKAALEQSKNYPYMDGVNHPEDRMILFFVMKSCLPVELVPYIHGKHVGVHCLFPGQREGQAEIVHCGETLMDGTRAPREMVLLRMECMNQLVEERKKPSPF